MSALGRWRASLEAWAIPQAIVDAAPESPYGFPTDLFRSRGERATGADETPTTRRALELLPEGGKVLDVGCGGGATSLPLAGRASVIVGVDAQEDMLEGFLANARAAGQVAEAVAGRWPEVAGRIPPVDLALAGHVLYNVPDLEPFVRALLSAVRVGMVLEMTERHPLHWMNDLWTRFHSHRRPEGPTVDDAIEALRELGLDPTLHRWSAPSRPGGGFARREDAVALIRRRLCLPRERDNQIGDALGDRLRSSGGLWSAGPADQALATVSVEVSSGARPR